MKVLGRSTSGNVQKVLMLLEEMGEPYTREDYGRQFGNTADAAYLAMNPTGKVPTLQDGAVTIWESNTIMRYLAAKAGSPLYPADLAERSRVERWMDWLLASVNDAYMTGFKASRAGEPVPAAAAAALSEALAMMDGALAGRNHLAGDQLSLADICVAPIIHRVLRFGLDLPELPSLRAWHARMAERAAFQKVADK